MDPNWVVKKDEWSSDSAGAIPFLQAVRVLFAVHELIERFSVLRCRVSASGLRSTRGDFQSCDGVFVFERHLPPDLGEDRALLLQALEQAGGA